MKAHLHEAKVHDECVEKEEEADDVADEAEPGDDEGARVQAEPKERFHFWETHSSPLLSNCCRCTDCLTDKHSSDFLVCSDNAVHCSMWKSLVLSLWTDQTLCLYPHYVLSIRPIWRLGLERQTCFYEGTLAWNEFTVWRCLITWKSWPDPSLESGSWNLWLKLASTEVPWPIQN